VNRALQVVLALTLLGTALLLAGCPKNPSPTPGGGAAVAGPALSAGATGVRPSGGAPAGPGTGVTTAPGAATGGPGASGASAPGSSLAGAGTTLPALPAPREYVENPALTEIHFDFDRYDIRPQDKERLAQNAEWLRAHTGVLLLVEGHADERGTNDYNLALGERRANAARDYLASLGIAGSRVTTISYGEERPLCTERDEGCWVKNRRARFLVKP
jgi:peptidoglycan-associated lipoprotein